MRAQLHALTQFSRPPGPRPHHLHHHLFDASTINRIIIILIFPTLTGPSVNRNQRISSSSAGLYALAGSRLWLRAAAPAAAAAPRCALPALHPQVPPPQTRRAFCKPSPDHRSIRLSTDASSRANSRACVSTRKSSEDDLLLLLQQDISSFEYLWREVMRGVQTFSGYL